MNAPDPVQRLLADARRIKAQQWVSTQPERLYERFKADLVRLAVDHETYQRACVELAKICKF